MKNLVVLLFALLCAGPTWAEDEMKTEVKGVDGSPAAPGLSADGAVKTGPPSVKPPSSADLALRTQVRKAAPFWIDDNAHGAAIRINKDGTFSSAAQGGGSIAGTWKTVGGQLQLSWSGGGDEYAYPVKASKNAITIRGKKKVKNRFNLN